MIEASSSSTASCTHCVGLERAALRALVREFDLLADAHPIAEKMLRRAGRTAAADRQASLGEAARRAASVASALADAGHAGAAVLPTAGGVLAFAEFAIAAELDARAEFDEREAEALSSGEKRARVAARATAQARLADALRCSR